MNIKDPNPNKAILCFGMFDENSSKPQAKKV